MLPSTLPFRFAATLGGISILALSACGGSAAPPSDAAVDAQDADLPVTARVDTEYGPVDGAIDYEVNNIYYSGIPYAAPPTGARRFRPPEPPTAWTTPVPAGTLTGVCPQKLPFGASGLNQGTEDCLFLNVAAPRVRSGPVPVVVWFHGGGFSLGAGEQADRATQGKRLAGEQGVVVVTINYRLGQLGFLAHPALTAEQGGHSGNYGLLDQLAALRWIKRNIAAFGGDPGRIVVHGQSAGGMSICALMASPTLSDPAFVPVAERPLFHAAVLQSAPCDVPVPALLTAEAQGARFAQLVGCDDAANPATPAEVLACLRDPTRLTVDTARATMPPPNDFIRPNASLNEAFWGPIVDGSYVVAHPVDRIRAGTFERVPVFAGFTEDEGDASMHFHLQRSGNVANGIVRITSSTLFDSEFNKLFAGGATQADRDAVYATVAAPAEYKAATYTAQPLASTSLSPNVYTPEEQAYARIVGDMNLACPARRTLIALEAQGVSAHAYFTRIDGLPFQVTPVIPLGAFHSGDVQLFFGVPAGGALLGMSFDPTEATLSDLIRGYHGAFIRTSDPNGGTRPNLPPYVAATRSQLSFDATPTVLADPKGTVCAVWDALGRDRIGAP